MLTPLFDWAGRIARNRRIARAMFFAADPAHRAMPPPGRIEVADLPLLVRQAQDHAVLPAVLRSLRPLAETLPGSAQAVAGAAEHARMLVVHSMMLRGFADALMADLRGLPVALVKGLAFARAIYPEPQLRPFTDIDLLLSPAAGPAVEEVLRAHGFGFVEHDIYGTAKWVHRRNDALMVEMQLNLVQSARMRPGISLSFDDLALVGAGRPAAHLVVAVVHGAVQHQFETLRQAVDILQAARGVAAAADEAELERLVARTGTRLAAVAGLDLAWRLFGEPRCRDLARGLGPAPLRPIAGVMLNRAAILAATTHRFGYYRWCRNGLRELLKIDSALAARLSRKQALPSPARQDAA